MAETPNAPDHDQKKCARGALIVFEGLDRVGKSTQTARIVEALQNQGSTVELIKFPDRTTAIGKTINNYLQNTLELDDKEVHLMFSRNRWELFSKMKDMLLSGTHLIVDRYSYSGVAYSVAKGLDFDWCAAPERGLLAPDLVVEVAFLKDKSVAQKRGGYGDERYEKQELQARAGENFELFRSKISPSGKWKAIEADASRDAMADDIETAVANAIADVHKDERPLEYLQSMFTSATSVDIDTYTPMDD